MAAHAGPARWWEKDTAPGYVLLGATLLSFLLANGPTAALFQTVLKAPVEITFGAYQIDTSVRYFIKDALMAVFFLFVGLELKREVLEGPFRNPREAALPMLGAIGGMAAPALIYLYVATIAHPAGGPEFARGWAIPAATDIAFAVGVLSLLGARVPAGLRLFLLALAIVDDLGAILVIALFYSDPLEIAPLAVAAGIWLVMMGLNARGVKALTPYWVLAVLLWAAMAKTGMSPTLAGVLAAVAVPMRNSDGGSPLLAAEHALKPYVQLGIMPLFALAIAGVPLAGVTMDQVFHPIALGVAAGLVIGKPLGIVTLSWIGAKLLRQPPPAPVPQMLGVSMIAGIGFTMSLFVGALAFRDPALAAPVRFGVLGGSLVSAVLGLALLNWALSIRKPGELPSESLAAGEQLAEAEGLIETIDQPKR